MSATAVTRIPAADAPLPLVLAGPILRRLTPDRLAIWLALSAPANARLSLDANDGVSRCHLLTAGDTSCRHLAAGHRLHYLLIDLTLDTPLPTQRWIGYTLSLQDATRPNAPWLGWAGRSGRLTCAIRGAIHPASCSCLRCNPCCMALAASRITALATV